MNARKPLLPLLLLLAATAAAQPEPAEELGPTDPRPVEITAADGMMLSGVFYPAENADRDTPVVVMIPDEGESPAIFDRLAESLQLPGRRDDTPMSVLAVALRGQGDSTRVMTRGGEAIDRRGKRLKPADAAAMVRTDLEAVRRYLVERNDAGELNLNRLAYLGVGAGGLVALNGAAVDWQVRDLDRGKQGCDVRALVLLSPRWKWLGLEALPALRQPGVRTQVAALVSYGEQLRSAKSESQRIVKQLRMDRPKPGEKVKAAPAPQPAVLGATDSDEEEEKKPPRPLVAEIPGQSRLQGTAWLKQWGRDGEDTIRRFLELTVVEPDFPWVKRRLD